MNKYKIIIFIFIGAFLIFLSGCDKDNKDKPNLRSVILTDPIATGADSSETYSGIIEEGKSVNVSFMADGKILRLNVKEGDRVRKGQLLASLDDTDYQIGVNQLKAQFNQMTEEKKRMDEMYNRHNIAPNDYEKFSAGYEQLRLQMEMADNKLGYTKLYSPTDGYVSEKFMEPGELVGAGTPVFKITDDSGLIANVDLPVNLFLNRDNIISTVGLSPALPDGPIPLAIQSFTPDPSNNMLYRMKLTVPKKYSGIITPGMNIRVEIETSQSGSEGYLVPSRAVFDENDKSYLWIYNPADSTISKKEVAVIGTPMDKNIRVSGLKGNEKIIQTGVKQLYEGEKVNVSNNSDYGL